MTNNAFLGINDIRWANNETVRHKKVISGIDIGKPSDSAGNHLNRDTSSIGSTLNRVFPKESLKINNNRVTDGLMALYTFQEGSGNTVGDVSGVGSPLDLTVGTPANTTWISGGGLNITGESLLSSTGAATKIINGAKTTDELTVEVWVRPANTSQSGPARMASVSGSSSSRNFTLGQDGNRYTMRRRTTGTDNNGLGPLFTPFSTVTSSLTHVVYTHGSGIERIYVDGVSVVNSSKGNDYSQWSDTYRFLVTGEENSSGSRFWLGEIYLVAVYDKALSSTEVTQNYNEGHIIGGSSGGSNQLPVANAGGDGTIILPDNSITLNGSGSDSDGSISTYLWAQTEGVTAVINNINAPSTSVTFPESGSYTFQLTVTDNEGGTGSDLVTITVNPEPSGNGVVDFTLMDAATDLPIAGYDPITSGSNIDLSAITTTQFNIRANTNPATVGSVVMTLTPTGVGTNRTTTESVGPYALFGDSGGDYNPWTAPGPQIGESYTLNGKAYDQSGGGGNLINDFTINFSFGSSPPQPIEVNSDVRFCLPCEIPSDPIGKVYNLTDIQGGSGQLSIIDPNDCQIGYYKMAIHFSYDRLNDFIDTNWSSSISFSVKNTANNHAVLMDPLTMNVTSDANTQKVEQVVVFEDKNKNTGKMTFECTDASNYVIDISNFTSSLPVGANVKLETKLYQVQNENITPGQVTINNLNIINENNEGFSSAEISWDPEEGALEYDLEWTFIDFFDDDATKQNPFSKEPIRITIPQQALNKYSIPLTYPKGALYFRVRGVGRDKDNPQQRLEGVWQENLGVPVAKVLIDDGTNGTAPEFEVDKNWQCVKTYAEDGKFKEVVSFYDGSLRNRQTLTNLSTDNNTLIAETKYDYEGRAVVNMLPVPRAGNNLNYQPSYFKFDTNDPNDPIKDPKSVYDNLDLSTSSLPLQTINGGAYYSPANAFTAFDMDYVPDAEGYAYTQVVYTNDNTGRIRSQSGVGKTFRLKEGSEQKGKTTEYFYAGATATELRRLFGSNVGEASHYQKNMVVDPNGQVSVSYMDQEGRVVATALAGESPNNLEQLDSYNITTLTVDMTDNTLDYDFVSNAMVTTNEIPNAVPGTNYQVNYDLSATLSNLSTACPNCAYDIEIYVTDPNGLELRREESTTTCTNGNSTIDFEFTAADIGNYTLVKTLKLAEEQFEAVRTEAERLVRDDILKYSLSDMEAEVQDYIQAKGDDYCIIGTEPDDIDALISDVVETTCELKLEALREAVYDAFVLGFPGETIPQVEAKVESFISAVVENINTDNYEPPYPPEIVQNKRDVINVEIDCYRHCFVHIESDKFDRRLGAISTYSEAVAKGYANPVDVEINGVNLPWTSTNGFDPYFAPDGVGESKFGDMQAALTNIEETVINRDTGAEQLVDLGNIWEAINDDRLYNGGVIEDDIKWRLFLSFYQGAKDKIKNEIYPSPCPQDNVNLDYTDIELVNEEYLTPITNEFFDYRNLPASEQSQLITGQIATLSALCNYDIENDANLYNLIFNNLNTYFNRAELNTTLGQDINVNFLGLIFKNHFDEENTSDNYNELVEIENELKNNPNLSCSLEDIAIDPIKCRAAIAAGTLSENLNKAAPLFNGSSNAGTGDIHGHFSIGNQFTFEATINTQDIVFPSGKYTIFSRKVKSGTNTKGYAFGITENSVYIEMDNNLLSVPANLFDGKCHHVAVTGAKTVSTPPEIYSFYIDGEKLLEIETSGKYLETNPIFTGVPFFYVGADRMIDNNGNLVFEEYFQGMIQEVKLWEKVLTHEELIQRKNITIDENFSDFDRLLGYWKFNEGNGDNINDYSNNGYPLLYSSPNWNVAKRCEGDVVCDYDISQFTLNITGQELLDKYEADCKTLLEEEARLILTERFEEEVARQTAALLENLYTSCFKNIQENYAYTFESSEYHYTLYYYDQAGNLVQTVPPEGVEPLTSAAFDGNGKWNGTSEPQHRMLTKYKYNSIEQLREQTMPDHEGPTNFWYDTKGQLRLSQNAKQNADNPNGNYSYTKYDEQGRIIEVGQLEPTVALTGIDNLIQDANFPDAATYTLTQITRTYYDALNPANTIVLENDIGNFTATNPRGRVVAVETFNDLNSATGEEGSATVYAYDPHGNVASLLQIVPDLGSKRTDYCYDLVSGNVNFVHYQYGEGDHFAHHYLYDADNRITAVQTSRDGYLWEDEAQYKYYPHGPLQRIEIGSPTTSNETKHIQGIDYYYTLQGWIKGVNMVGRDATLDPGQDGVGASFFPKDEMAYSIGYYEDDYKAINNADLGAAAESKNIWAIQQSTIGHNGLYNGNIALMLTEVPELGRQLNQEVLGTQAMLYGYDQLNRIKKGRSLTNYDPATGWAGRNNSTLQPYDTDYTYDANGNLISLLRKNNEGNASANYTYEYNYDVEDKLINNKLLYVNNDAETPLQLQESITYNNQPIPAQTNNYKNITATGSAGVANGEVVRMIATDGIELSPGFEAAEGADFIAEIGLLTDGQGTGTSQATGNYAYDEIGNLIKDDSENITEITWTVYGKVGKVTKSTGDVTEYRYDAAGNRISKKVVPANGTTVTTHYVRDASGNTMAIYKDTQVAEQPIYGSARLGRLISGGNAYEKKWGLRQYELSNHLGNVLAVVDDYRVEVDNNGTTEVQAKVVSANDYYPFGMTMPTREFSTDGYRYGFNGKENDKDFGNDQLVQDYGFRIYNPAIGKFLSVDPLTKSYPMLTPYQFASNTPIFAIDLDGLEAVPGAEMGGLGLLEVLGLKSADEVNELIDLQANGTVNGAIGTTAAVGAYFGVNWLYNNWVYAVYNPVFHNEVAATIYGTVADNEWPLPAVGDNVSKTTRIVISRSNREIPYRKIGDIVFEGGSSFANDAERRLAIKLLEEGKDVTILAERKGGGRRGDFLIGEDIFEVKTISGVKNTSSDNLSKQIASRISDSRKNGGQAENLIIDVTSQEGASLEVTKRGVFRALGKSQGIKDVRIIGDGFDETIRNRNYKGKSE